MNKKLQIILMVFLPLLTYCQTVKKKSKNKVHTRKNSSTNNLTPGEIELAKFRQENPIFFKNHIEGLADSAGKTNIDYSNFNGKDCSEIAKKENWGKWSPPDNADEKCKKYLKSKSLKKVLLYPLK